MSTRAWREANKEHLQIYGKQYRAKHKVRDKRRKKLWIARNYDKYLIQNKKNWERKKANKMGLPPIPCKTPQPRRSTVSALHTYLREKLNNAKQRKPMGFTLTLDQLIQHWIDQDGCCAVTKVPMEFGPDSDPMFIISLDRINSDGPYTDQNTRLVTWWVNIAKHTMRDAQLVVWCQLVCRANHSGQSPTQ